MTSLFSYAVHAVFNLFFFTEDALILNAKDLVGMDVRMLVYTVDRLIKDCTDCAIVNVGKGVKH